MDNNKEMIEGLVSQILDDYHDVIIHSWTKNQKKI